MIARLPQRRKHPKMGVQKPAQKVWPRHRRFVKSHGCCVPGCIWHGIPDDSPIDFAHLRSAANSGTGMKPHDIFGVSLCREHHDEQHRLGPDTFGRKYGIDLWALAREFLRLSPDLAMKDSLKLVELQDGLA